MAKQPSLALQWQKAREDTPAGFAKAASDLTTWKREIADLTGIRYAGGGT